VRSFAINSWPENDRSVLKHLGHTTSGLMPISCATWLVKANEQIPWPPDGPVRGKVLYVPPAVAARAGIGV
jgi:hypothetical protein